MAAAADLRRRAVAEAIGTALLLATVLFRWLVPPLPELVQDIDLPHSDHKREVA